MHEDCIISQGNRCWIITTWNTVVITKFYGNNTLKWVLFLPRMLKRSIDHGLSKFLDIPVSYRLWVSQLQRKNLTHTKTQMNTIEKESNVLCQTYKYHRYVQYTTVVDPDLKLRRGVVLFCLPCLFFSLLRFLPFLPKNKEGPTLDPPLFNRGKNVWCLKNVLHMITMQCKTILNL